MSGRHVQGSGLVTAVEPVLKKSGRKVKVVAETRMLGDHRPTFGRNRTCVHDGLPWPCPAVEGDPAYN